MAAEENRKRLINEDTSEVLSILEQQGYRGRIVSIGNLPELQEGIQGRFKKGLFDEEFYRLRLSFFDFRIPETLPNAKSIIVAAVPRPQAQATFMFRSKKRPLILPPTYVAYNRTTEHVTDVLNEALKKKGYRTAKTLLPLKLLAVRSGLAEYGRNNITYVSGFGSFYQLVAVYSDLPCKSDSWQEPRMMKQCESCQACLRSCPTKAISSDRFLLHAERCIVFHNEKKGSIPFPDWINPSWHHCLYGCMHCQRACPEDRHFLDWIGEKEEFSQEETELLLKGNLPDHLTETTLQKLKNLDLADTDSLDNLPRNLRILFEPS
jgi:epoxyqueuosine reductase